jgi:hypothetical protein
MLHGHIGVTAYALIRMVDRRRQPVGVHKQRSHPAGGIGDGEGFVRMTIEAIGIGQGLGGADQAWGQQEQQQ